MGGLANNIPAAAALVGIGLTTAFASLRFFSDKAAKITDFRKAWIETLRPAVAEFSANTHAIGGRVAIRTRHSVTDTPKSQSMLFDFEEDMPAGAEGTTKTVFDQKFESELLPNWVGLRLAYNKTILHLNPQEHGPYLNAEMAVADYYRVFGSAADEDAVNRFLRRCIDHAYASLQGSVTQLPASSIAALAAQTTQSDDSSWKTGISQFDERKIFLGKIKPAEALLLAMFATRQLLHGSYHTLDKRMADIEHGIRVVDSAAAIVIKFVWSEIKDGEPGYRKISWFSLGLSALVLIIVGLALLYSTSDTPKASSKVSCRARMSAVLPPFSEPYMQCEISPGG